MAVNKGTFTEILEVIANSSLPALKRSESIRSIADRDIDWMICRIIKLEGFLHQLEHFPIKNMKECDLQELVRKALEEEEG